MKLKTLGFSIAFILLILLTGCTTVSEYHADDPAFYYTGRIDFSQPEAPVFYWPGTSVAFRFEGPSLSIVLEDHDGENYYNVFVDDYKNPIVIDCNSGRAVYPIATQLKDTVHTALIFKRTECEGSENYTTFHGVVLARGKSLHPVESKPQRRIEYFGNSITCGYGIEAPIGEEEGLLASRNNWLAYSALTARELNAEYHCSSKSGIGITISWFNQIMPEIWDRLAPWNPESQWDFSQWTPDVVVVNLFQNDSWLVNLPDHPEFQRRFSEAGHAPSPDELIDAYVAFIRDLRSVYPDQPIICALGSMDAVKAGSPWPDYIRQAVHNMKTEYDDTNLYVHIFEYDGLGLHPKIKDHEKMASELANLIRSIEGWD